MKLIDQIIGYRTVSVPTLQQNHVRRVLKENRINFYEFEVLDDISIFKISAHNFKRASQFLAPFHPEFGNMQGLPAFLLRHKTRYGLFLGVTILLISLAMSQSVVWDIRISGNENISDEEILAELSDVGLEVGTPFHTVDFDRLRNRFLLSSGEISWISVNMTGVVANVEVREYQEGASDHPVDFSPRNIVAASDGQISVITVKAGKKVVEVGQVVKEGDLLISGILDSQSLGVRYEHADGEVYAYVNKEISIEIPLHTTEKVPTGRTFKKISLNIFGKIINIFSNCRNSMPTCDKIVEKKQILLFNRFAIPVHITTETYQEYSEQSKTLTVSEAVDLAMAKLSKETAQALEHAELISRTVSTQGDQEKIRVTCKIYCIEDIAKPLEFKIS